MPILPGCVRQVKTFASRLRALTLPLPNSLSSDNLGIREDNCYECDDLARKSRKSKAELDLPPDSAKTRKVMELLAEIDERCQDGNKEKTIIFSQFTSMLDLFQPFLKAKGIKFVRCKSCPYMIWLCC